MGANLHNLQSKGNLAFDNATLWVPNSSEADFPIQDLRIISRPRAYIETAMQGAGGPSGSKFRQRIISNGVS